MSILSCFIVNMEQDIFYDMFLLFSLLSQKNWLPLRPSREVAGAARQFCTISCGCCLRGVVVTVRGVWVYPDACPND